MKAIVRNAFGPPEVLELQEVEKPDPTDDDVLVRVHAAAVNRQDWS
jgi:NADPH:quinone reductase-like Zn-dependent oxidoreductase